MQKITIILEDDILQFVDSQAKDNRSTYINEVLKEHRRCELESQMITALQEGASQLCKKPAD
ncbi:MAG: CopG family transcriptional regulator [Cyanobacteria bacterium J06643_5]